MRMAEAFGKVKRDADAPGAYRMTAQEKQGPPKPGRSRFVLQGLQAHTLPQVKDLSSRFRAACATRLLTVLRITGSGIRRHNRRPVFNCRACNKRRGIQIAHHAAGRRSIFPSSLSEQAYFAAESI